ncbi:MAG: HAD-IB family hydrolase [Actinobacteria bacterium]|nr:HAD-IB family hydrolase [Actinomycetota bacterium]MCB8996898.1 HAD-IB family hydrolase [Actinomycetota bacterium]
MSTAAFFDLDGTLIPGSANIPLAKAAFRQGFASPTEVLKDLRNGVSFLLKGATDERSAQVRDRILQAVQGHRAADVEALGDYFIHDLVASITPAMREVLDRHGVAGEDRIVVSASPTEIVSRLAHGAGLEYGVGTTAARDEAGVYTGDLTGPFCYKEGKVEVMQTLAAEKGYDLAECYAYTDSASDMPMLEAVGHPVVVNPEPELREIAAERGWPIVETSSVPRVKLSSARGLTRMAKNLAAAVGRRALPA